MAHRLRLLVYACILLHTGNPLAGAIFHVAPGGSDSGNGTMARPFASIERACREVRKIRNTATGQITIALQGGIYRPAPPFRITGACSGTPSAPVVVSPASTDPVLLSGGLPIRGWTVSDSTRNIHKAAGIDFEFRQLYVNGAKRTRARTPNATGCANAPRFQRIQGLDRNARTILVETPRGGIASSATNPVELHLMTYWSDNTLRIEAAQAQDASSVLSFSSPESEILFTRANPPVREGQMYYLENSLSFLDAPGEWFLDKAARTLYYKAFPHESMGAAVVVAPRLETILAIEGSREAPVEHVTLRGLHIAHSTDLRPSRSGHLTAQAAQYQVPCPSDAQECIGRPGAALSAVHAHHLRIERCAFSKIASTAIDFREGVKNSSIVGNAIFDVGGNGISVGKFVQDSSTSYNAPYAPSDTSELCSKDTIRNNAIANTATEIQGACSIACGHVRRIDIEHNEIWNTSYSGISVGFGWNGARNTMTANRISRNAIHHAIMALADGAGIYTLSNQGDGSEIAYNLLSDMVTSPWADYSSHSIFLDEGTSGFDVVGNTMRNSPSDVFHNLAGTNREARNGPPNSSSARAGLEDSFRGVEDMMDLPELGDSIFLESGRCTNTIYNATISPHSDTDVAVYAATAFRQDSISALEFRFRSRAGGDRYEARLRYASDSASNLVVELDGSPAASLDLPASDGGVVPSPGIPFLAGRGTNVLRLQGPSSKFPDILGLEILRSSPEPLSHPRGRWAAYRPRSRTLVLVSAPSKPWIRICDIDGRIRHIPLEERPGVGWCAKIPPQARGILFALPPDGLGAAVPLVLAN